MESENYPSEATPLKVKVGGLYENILAEDKIGKADSINPATSVPWKQVIQAFIFVVVAVIGVVLTCVLSAVKADPVIPLIFYGMVIYYAWCLFFQESKPSSDEKE